ncbi:hypothetical protein ACQKGI_11680 [Peribacillus muralis]|uniref:hypothetical protein n=1 Tax=Peribacillus muralis TaxID=264697 RepID=UPI00382B0EB8
MKKAKSGTGGITPFPDFSIIQEIDSIRSSQSLSFNGKISQYSYFPDLHKYAGFYDRGG